MINSSTGSFFACDPCLEHTKRSSSAKWADFSVDEKGRMLASVQHDDVKGCTPEMIQWFFEHLGCCTTENGVEEGGFINKFIFPKLYSNQAGMEWIHQNIQETGRMQDILPVLYANKDKVFFDKDFIKFD